MKSYPADPINANSVLFVAVGSVEKGERTRRNIPGFNKHSWLAVVDLLVLLLAVKSRKAKLIKLL